MIPKTILRKTLVIFAIFSLVFIYNLGGTRKAKAWSTLDQFTVTANGYWRIQSHQIVGQTFRPTFNKLDGVGVYAGILPSGPASCSLTVKIYNASVVPPVFIGQTTMTIPKEETYNIADIGPLDVTPDARYEMRVTANSSYAYWLVNTSDIYPRGFAIIDSTPDANQDFIFATFGYNDEPPAEPSPTPEVDVDENLTGGDVATDIATGEAPSPSGSSSSSSTASILVAAPTNLVASVATEGSSTFINLSWTASKTSGVTGYTVFRSTSENTGFVEIGSTDAKTLTYRDDRAVNDQTYYYVVRANKNGVSSKNSNVVSAKITDIIAPSAPVNFQITEQSEEEINFSWNPPTENDIANYILTIVDNSGEIIEIIETIGKDKTNYRLKLSDHEKLVKNTKYTFYLQAKDVSNNFSEKAEVSGEFANEKKASYGTWITLGVAVLALAGAITFLIIRKRRKKTSVV